MLAQVVSLQPTMVVMKAQYDAGKVIGGTLWLLPCVKRVFPNCLFTSFSIISDVGSIGHFDKWLLRT